LASYVDIPIDYLGVALNQIVVANKRISGGSNHLNHMSLYEKPSDFESTWICDSVGRTTGASVAILQLYDVVRNNTDDTYAMCYSSNKFIKKSVLEACIRVINDTYLNIQNGEITTLSTYEGNDLPDTLDRIDICPLFLEQESIGWLALGYDQSSVGERSNKELLNLANVVSDLSLSFLRQMYIRSEALPKDAEKDILEALQTNNELAFAVFTKEGDKIMSSTRWTHFFDREDLFISSATIAKQWRPEWNRVLNGDTVKGRWVSSLNEGTPLNWTMIPWSNHNEIKGAIVFSDILNENTETTLEQKSHLLNKFITIEDERKRLARKLHDELAQSLSAALMSLELVDRDGDTSKIDDALQKTRSLLNQTISEIRTISQQLRPSIIDDFGLVTALKVLCNSLSKNSEKKIKFYAFQVDSDLPGFYQITVFRICQEALEYIMNITHASIINVQLFQRETSVLLHIHDEDSVDANTKWSSTERAGIEDYLNGIMEQTTLHNGDFHMDLQTENGTDLIIQFPLNDYSKELQDKSYEEN